MGKVNAHNPRGNWENANIPKVLIIFLDSTKLKIASIKVTPFFKRNVSIML